MYRRVLSLLLLPCLVLSQSAAIPHTHAAGQPDGHDFRSHVHISQAPTTHQTSHGHHHGPGGHHHDDIDEVESTTPAQIPPLHQPDHDHDTNAIYFTVTDLGGTTRYEVREVVTASCLWSPTNEIPLSNTHSDLGCREFWGHPPPADFQSPLYILHLTLLI
jgi:hypothetical protein